MARVTEFTLRASTRKYVVAVYKSITPEEVLVWLSKGEMFKKITLEETGIDVAPRDVKDQMIRLNVG
jgi:hypothetical protein